MDINFEFEGQTYTAPESFYDTNRFTLPDGRAIAASGWLETMPPKPQGLHVVAEVAAHNRPAHAALPPVERTQEAGTSYTRAQFAAAVDEAHGALHEADEAEDTDTLLRRVARAHDALHNVGAGQERIACATLDPEARAIHADLRALRDWEIPCGHTVADLVLRAMLRAYEAHAETCGVAFYLAGKADEPRTLAASQRADGARDFVRERLYMVCAGMKAPGLGPIAADYEARLRGDRPLDAPPPEVP